MSILHLARFWSPGKFGCACLLGLLLASIGCEQPAVSEQPETAPGPAAQRAEPATRNSSQQDQTGGESDAQDAVQADAVQPEHPFTHRTPAPEFPKDAEWINTGGPLRLRDLRGKFVLMDFWTYCCINCIHVLPELKKLERKYANELVVIGVHSAKFDTEKGTENIKEAALRYEIEHPIVNDAQHRIWDRYQVRSWPSIRLVDPEGNLVAGDSGEFTFELLDAFLQRVLPYYRQNGLVDETPLRFDLLSYNQDPTPLRFPGKVLADEASERLFVSDSNHNRIVVCSLDGQTLFDVIGSGQIGFEDGNYETATFDHPQGMALRDQTLFVADTENHAIRKVDLQRKRVVTIAGLGTQSRNPWPGLESLEPEDDLPERWVGRPEETALNSPWALWAHEEDLYIAMAGPHQIWKMSLDKPEIGPYAGNGREDIVDGPLLPTEPYAAGSSSFAQPSGLASDGQWLFVADSEGSSIRAVPFDPSNEVRTVVGTSQLPRGRLFAFGDADGTQPLSRYDGVGGFGGKLTGVLLQHVLGVVYHDGQIYVADTYNNKIKRVDAQTGETRTVAGTGEAGRSDEPARFDEPAGISYAVGKLYVADTNNHAVRVIDLKTGRVRTLTIAGLRPPRRDQPAQPSFRGATQLTMDRQSVRLVDGALALHVKLTLPAGWKVNPLAPMGYLVETKSTDGPVDNAALAGELTQVEPPATELDIRLPANGPGKDTIVLSLNYYYCQEGGEGLCKVGSVVWEVPIAIDEQSEATSIELSHRVDA